MPSSSLCQPQIWGEGGKWGGSGQPQILGSPIATSPSRHPVGSSAFQSAPGVYSQGLQWCSQGPCNVLKVSREFLRVTLKSSWCPQGPQGVPEVPKGVSNASGVVPNVPKVSLRVSSLKLQPYPRPAHSRSKLPSKMLPPSMFPVHCSMERKQERHIHPTGAPCSHPRFLWLCKDFFCI